MRPDEVPSKDIRETRKKLLEFASNGRLREYPWRGKDVKVFEYIVSEILLQQTRADSVANIYHDFFSKYEDWKDIKKSSKKEVAKRISRLGLQNQRTDRLKSLSEAVLKEGSVPCDCYEKLKDFPAIGQYVASAIVTRYSQKCKAMIDTNVVRILCRMWDLEVKADYRRDNQLRRLADRIVQGPNCLQLNWSLLDIGGVYCTASNPDHTGCPLCSGERCSTRL